MASPVVLAFFFPPTQPSPTRGEGSMCLSGLLSPTLTLPHKGGGLYRDRLPLVVESFFPIPSPLVREGQGGGQPPGQSKQTSAI